MSFNKKMSIRVIGVLLLSISLASFCNRKRVKRYHPVFEQGQFFLSCPVDHCPENIRNVERTLVEEGIFHHLKNSHSPHYLPSATCAVCSNTFTAFANLYAHYRRHLDLPSHSCEYCGTEFLNSSDLKRHDATCGSRTTIPSIFALGNP